MQTTLEQAQPSVDESHRIGSGFGPDARTCFTPTDRGIERKGMRAEGFKGNAASMTRRMQRIGFDGPSIFRTIVNHGQLRNSRTEP